MIQNLEITVDIIAHATEDIRKICSSLEILEINENNIEIEQAVGHFNNPITTLHAKIVKKQAHFFMVSLLKELSAKTKDSLVNEIQDRTADSRYHLRLDKQELIQGKIKVDEKGTIKVKIHTPIYNKKDTVKKFTEIFQIVN